MSLSKIRAWWRGCPIRATRRLLQGRLRARSDNPSLLYFTVHKCASVYAAELLGELAYAAGVKAVDIDAYRYLNGGQQLQRWAEPRLADLLTNGDPSTLSDEDRELLRRLLPAQGFCFGPFRRPACYLEVADLQSYRTVLMLRDPRDVLTSHYFSAAYSHFVPVRNSEARLRQLAGRERSMATDIDHWVLCHAESYLKTYATYCDKLLRSPNVRLLRYEDMVYDFEGWLRALIEHWGIAPDEHVIHRLIRSADFSVRKEDKYSHKRQVQPGDHRRKLQPETIARLDAIFEDLLLRLGYEQQSYRLSRFTA